MLMERNIKCGTRVVSLGSDAVESGMEGTVHIDGQQCAQRCFPTLMIRPGLIVDPTPGRIMVEWDNGELSCPRLIDVAVAYARK